MALVGRKWQVECMRGRHLQLQCQFCRPKAFFFPCNLFCRPPQHAPRPTHKNTRTELFRWHEHTHFDQYPKHWRCKLLWTTQTSETKQSTWSWSPNKVHGKALVHHTNYKHLHKKKKKVYNPLNNLQKGPRKSLQNHTLSLCVQALTTRKRMN